MTLTAWGLVAGMVGAILVAVATPQVVTWRKVVDLEEPDAEWKGHLRMVGFYLGWMLLVLGFALQLAAEVCK